jgi:17beta-estradiol 17-dehydrogenase / very-long-chain 3-oxoacyl-CoA reductase
MEKGHTSSLPLPTIFAVVGLITVMVAFIRLWNLIRIYIRPSRLARYAHPSRSGDDPWALVTGSTDGIGRAFARQLAESGFNVVLHGRNPEKLHREMTQLQETFPQRSFRILIADASTVGCIPCQSNTRPNNNESQPAPLDFAAIQKDLEDINLTILINNAGGGPSNPSCLPLTEFSESKLAANISLNALFPLHLMRALFPILKRNAPSLVINISSLADPGFPLLVSYSASKAFLMSATRAVRLEMKMEGLEDDVEILGVRVGRVTGSSTCQDPVSLFVPDAKTMATAALARAGYKNGIVIGYWGHALQKMASGVLLILPRWAEDKLITTLMRQQRDSLDGGTKTPKTS